jgi:urease accessory protein
VQTCVPTMDAGRVSPVAAGTGSVRVARGRRGSVVTHAFASSPLKWLTPRNRGDAAWLFSSSYGGGLVAGDALDVELTVEPDAAALLATQSSTKVYRSTRASSISLRAAVGDGAMLVNLPDPVVCFAHSQYRQVQVFDLGHRASLIALDWMTSGRRAHGERWAFDDYGARATVRTGGHVVAYDSVRLSSRDGDLAARMGRFDVLAVLIIVGTPLAAHVGGILSAVNALAPERRSSILIAAAPVADSGCVVRLAGAQVEDVRRAVRDLLAFVPGLLGDDPWARKW